ncbi:helix-turn-helix domain-containing protein [Symbiobacterium terraclitae]|uniref:helix-turn-helix domain-containing protein n=1 Tax=Symbiobacterium terraclitae TaxID=557451 RepID=UPI0035B4FF48
MRQLRLERGETQRQLAEAVGASESAIANYEAERREPEAAILLRIAARYGVSSEYLMGLTDDPRRQKDLPPGWEQVLTEAARHHMSPDEVTALIRQVGEFIQKRRGDS